MQGRAHFFVRCCWDEEAHVWYVEDSNVPGLSTEAESERAMTEKLLRIIPELLVLNESVGDDYPDEEEVPFELLYSRREHFRRAAG